MDTEKIFVCENCGFPNEMIYHNCKIVCQHCGFMLDCSDLDVGNEIKQASLRQSRAKDKTAERKK
jgi:transcription initiation factor TFIIIB Brf1 subunit/transcription initiation factor TFIIB